MKEWVNAEVVKFHWNGVMVAWYRYVFCLSCGSWPSLRADKVTEYIQNYICCCGGVKWPRAVFSSLDFCCMMLRISTVYAVTQCVHLSVTFICAVKLSKRSIKTFSPSVIHTILVFFHIKRSNIPTWTEAKIVIFDQHLALLDGRISSTFWQWSIGYST